MPEFRNTINWTEIMFEEEKLQTVDDGEQSGIVLYIGEYIRLPIGSSQDLQALIDHLKVIQKESTV